MGNTCGEAQAALPRLHRAYILLELICQMGRVGCYTCTRQKQARAWRQLLTTAAAQYSGAEQRSSRAASVHSSSWAAAKGGV